MIKVIIIAVLAFFYYWLSQKLSVEKLRKQKISFIDFAKSKDDEILRSIIAMIIILLLLPQLVQGIRIWFNINPGIGLSLIQLFVGFLSGMIGTFIVDKFTAFSKRKLKEKME